MFGTTTLVTVGHALNRAQDEGLTVRINLAGEWITGRIINNDGHGVAVLEGNGDVCVLRTEAISAVRLPHRPGDARPAPRVPLQPSELNAQP